MMRLILTMPCALVLFATSAFSDNLPTSQGRWSLGGSATFPLVYNKYRAVKFGYSLSPEAGYFVVDGLELSFGATLTNDPEVDFTKESQLNPPSNLFWGVKVGAAYYIPVSECVQPYFGLDVGTLMESWELKQIFWYLKVPLGVTWFINQNVALNFGIPLTLQFNSTSIFDKLNVSPGYLGLKALF